MPKVILFNLSNYVQIGLKSIRETLRQKGINCSIIDFSKEIEKSFENNSQAQRGQLNANKAIDLIKQKIENYKPEIKKANVLGMSFFIDMEEIPLRTGFSRYLKKTFPQKTLVGGGPGITSDARNFLQNAQLDYAIKGEGEKAFVELVNALARKNYSALQKIDGIVYKNNQGKIIESKKIALLTEKELNKIPFIKTTWKTKDETAAIVYTERGCPNACIYCSAPRKANLISINEEKIISGMLKLVKNKSITAIHFANDTLFSEKEKVERLLNKIIETGLNKRFQFYGLATVNSLLRNGEPDLQLINLMKKANFNQVDIGTESLNNNILKELKSGKYTNAQAIKVNEAIKKAGFSVSNFMIAGGIETRAIEFIESYYAACALSAKAGRNQFYFQRLLEGVRNSPIYRKALKEKLIYTQKGIKTNPLKDRKPMTYFIMPKDPELRKFFLNSIRHGKHWITSYDIDQVINLAKKIEATEPKATKFKRKMMALQANEVAEFTGFRTIANNILRKQIQDELINHKIPINKNAAEEFYKKNPALRKKTIIKSADGADEFFKKQKVIEGLTENARTIQEKINRLREIKKARDQFGFSILNPRRKTWQAFKRSRNK